MRISAHRFPRADAYTRRFAHIVRLDLPEGTIDLARNIPIVISR